MVISGGNFKPDTLKPKEVVSLLLDDEEIEMKCELIRDFYGREISKSYLYLLIPLMADRQEAKLQSPSPVPAETQGERKRRHPNKVSVRAERSAGHFYA